jgi:dihydrofolate reductase
MTKLRVHCFSVSLDGFAAGANQSLEQPLGVGGMGLHGWLGNTRTFRALFGHADGETGADDDFMKQGFENIGAWILGRNMFGPVRGPWPDESWRGWWGANPPYHCDVFVLTHHARASIEMEGGTVFHFVTEGIESALDQARAAAKGKDVRLGGGVATIRAYLNARLVDSLHLGVSPVLLGAGEALFAGLDVKALGYACTKHVATANATHYVLKKQ